MISRLHFSFSCDLHNLCRAEPSSSGSSGPDKLRSSPPDRRSLDIGGNAGSVVIYAVFFLNTKQVARVEYKFVFIEARERGLACACPKTIDSHLTTGKGRRCSKWLATSRNANFIVSRRTTLKASRYREKERALDAKILRTLCASLVHGLA